MPQKDSEQDMRIGVLEGDVKAIGVRLDASELRADDRHAIVIGTVTTAKDTMADFRREAQEREDRAEQRRHDAAERAEAAKIKESEDRRAFMRDPKTYMLAAAALFLVLAPGSAPRLLDYGAQAIGLEVHKDAPAHTEASTAE